MGLNNKKIIVKYKNKLRTNIIKITENFFKKAPFWKFKFDFFWNLILNPESLEIKWIE